MKATLKSIAVAGAFALVVLSSGCASVSVGPEEASGNVGERPDYVLSQLDNDSRGK